MSRRPRILIVSLDPILIRKLEQVCRREYELVLCSNAEDAEELLVDRILLYDLIIADRSLHPQGEGQDGLNLLKWVRVNAELTEGGPKLLLILSRPLRKRPEDLSSFKISSFEKPFTSDGMRGMLTLCMSAKQRSVG